jgi:type IV secretion system protein VirD4
MATMFARILAAIRGGIPSLTGHRPALQPQFRRAAARSRAPDRSTPDEPAGRTARIAGLRVKRLRQIAGFYADGAHEAVVTVNDCAFLPQEEFTVAAELIVRAGGDPALTRLATENALRKALLKRRLSELTDRDRAILRAMDLLCELGEFDRTAALRTRLPIVWNDGRCHVMAPGFETATRRNLLKTGLRTLFGEFARSAPDAFDELRRAWRDALSLDATLNEEEHQTLESLQFIERSWLIPAEPAAAQAAPAALSLGLFAGTERDHVYESSHALVTLAPASSGTRQGQIAQNLSHLVTGAVVIDVDGKAFHATARWRQKEVGKIIAFAPALADHSMHYNPLDAVGRDPAAGWNEAHLLADLLTGRNGPDEEARNFVAPAIYDVALNEAPERRHMGGVLARLACSNSQLDAWVATLSRSPHRELVRHGAALRELRPAKRNALVGRVLGELEVWRAPPIAGLSDRSDWTPSDLRRRATLYLCVDRRDIGRYAVVLRTIIGQTIAALSRDKTISPGSTVTLFLDELAGLGPMGTVERAVDFGPDFGVRPWMFFASSAQMRAVYPNADGMIANCAAHCYVEPDHEDVQEIVQRLGFVKSLFGTDERPLLTAVDLAGPEFAGKMIALVRGQPPARLVLPGAAKAGQRRAR